MTRKYRVRLMRTIIPGLWNVCVVAQTIEASAPNVAIELATDFVNQAAAKAGLFITATEIK